MQNFYMRLSTPPDPGLLVLTSHSIHLRGSNVLHLAPESDPGVGSALQHHSGDEGLVVAHVDAGQVAALLLAGRLRRVPRGRRRHQLVAVPVPGGVALRTGAPGRGRRVDAAGWGGSR